MKYSVILFAVLPVLIFLPAISSAERINGFDVEWKDASTYTLSWTSPSVSIEDYSIKVVDFDWEGRVAVSVTHKGETQNGIVSQGEYRIFDFTHNSSTFQGIKIDPDEISGYNWLENPPVNIGTYPCCPQAEISVSVAEEASPALNMVTSLNWDGRLGYESTMDIQIENTGEAAFSGGNLTIDTGGLIPDEKKLSDYGFSYNPSKHIISRVWSTPLLANNSYNTSVSLKPVQMAPNASTFIIKVDSNFRDLNGKIYTSTATSTVSLNNTINIEKTITSATAIGEPYTDDEDRGIVGLGKITVVNLYVTNLQSYRVRALNLTDSIIDGFDLVNNNTKLQWIFDINGSERKEFRYEMRARSAGSFEAPAATAKWTEWGATKLISSNKPSTRVYGAYVLITKSTRKTTFGLNESINVSVRLESTGDLPAGINVTDIIPKNTTLISGSTAFRGYVHPGEVVYITYELSADQTGELEFPSPQISFWKKDYQFSYKFKPAPNITIINSSTAVQGNAANINPGATLEPAFPVLTETPTTTEMPVLAQTPVPKGLVDIINEKAPWLEGVIPMVMLLVTIVLMLMLHVLNR
ncbi:Uncharacterised protein [uncultured archaeon]|nr:Uncharacterised protein [uncultured archaeon]